MSFQGYVGKRDGEVAEYLRARPGKFVWHAQLHQELRIPSGTVSGIIERLQRVHPEITRPARGRYLWMPAAQKSLPASTSEEAIFVLAGLVREQNKLLAELASKL